MLDYHKRLSCNVLNAGNELCCIFPSGLSLPFNGLFIIASGITDTMDVECPLVIEAAKDCRCREHFKHFVNITNRSFAAGISFCRCPVVKDTSNFSRQVFP